MNTNESLVLTACTSLLHTQTCTFTNSKLSSVTGKYLTEEIREIRSNLYLLRNGVWSVFFQLGHVSPKSLFISLFQCYFSELLPYVIIFLVYSMHECVLWTFTRSNLQKQKIESAVCPCSPLLLGNKQMQHEIPSVESKVALKIICLQ